MSSELDHVRELYGRIYQVVRKIPRGSVATYGQVAELAGIPGGARVSGAAVQRQLLEDEGVTVGDTGLVALDEYGWLSPDKKTARTARSAARAGKDVAVTAGSSRGASPRRPLRSGSKRRASSSRR